MKHPRALLTIGLLCTAACAAIAKPIHVALICDDGPHPEQTPKLLKVFAAEGVHVTFGIVAKTAEQHPTLLEQVAAAGHEITNHSLSHEHPKQLSAAGVDEQVLEGQKITAKAAGVAPVWYWPPFIEVDDNVRASVAKAGIKIYRAKKLVVSGDYMNDVDGAEILRRATTGIEDGAVILFHEWRPETAQQMPAVIKELKKQGCVFLTFSEMATYLEQWNASDHHGAETLSQTGSFSEKPAEN